MDMNSAIAPRRLRSGSKVAIVAPSGPIITNEVQVGIDIIRECGLEPVLGPCVKNLKTAASHAASVQDRVEELNWAFSNPNISGVIGAVGGEGSAAVLPYLNYDVIRASRKVFLGMSDLTAINTGIFTKSRLITFNGQTPSIRLDKGKRIFDLDSDSFRTTLELLKSDQVWGRRPFQNNPHFPRTVAPGTTTGTVIGGNLDTFVHLIGTPYMTEFNNSILFIEDVHKDGMDISRESLHLRLSGCLNQVSGIVIGEFEDIPKKTDPKIPTIEDTVLEYFGGGPPCSIGYPFSHGPFTAPLPIGANCLLDANTGVVEFNFKMSS